MNQLDPDQLFNDLREQYWAKVCHFAGSLTHGNAEEAEALTLQALEEMSYTLCQNPEMVIERPEWWLRKAVYHRFLNSQRGKLQRNTTSLEFYQESQGATTEKLSGWEPQAPDEDEPEYFLEKGETEAEEKAAKKR